MMQALSLLIAVTLLLLSACSSPDTNLPAVSPTSVTPICAEPTPALQDMTADERLVYHAQKRLHFAPDHPITVEITDKAERNGRHFALLAVQNDWFDYYFVEYDEGGNILAWCCLESGAIAGTTGYMPKYVTHGNTKLCFALIAHERTATSEDGTLILDTRQANDYTAIRFIMADGSTVDTPVSAGGYMAVQDFAEWPVSAVPIAGDTAVTAFEMKFNKAYEAGTP